MREARLKNLFGGSNKIAYLCNTILKVIAQSVGVRGFDSLNGRNKSGGVLCESNTIMVKPGPSTQIGWNLLRDADKFTNPLI